MSRKARAAEGEAASPHLRGRVLWCEHEECGGGEPSGRCCSSEGCERGIPGTLSPGRGSPPLVAPQWLAPGALPPPGRMRLSCCPCCPPVSNDRLSVVAPAGEDSTRVTGASSSLCTSWEVTHVCYQYICSVLLFYFYAALSSKSSKYRPFNLHVSEKKASNALTLLNPSQKILKENRTQVNGVG